MRTTSLPERIHRDDGVTVILVALVLVSLMVFAAFAVDVSGVYSARRSDQSAADTAALGGLQTLLEAGSTGAQVEAQVIDLVVAAVGTQAASFDWNACPIADDDVIDTPVNGKSCITTTSAKDVLQVKLPVQNYPSGFAGMVGVTLKHSAFAIAGIEPVGLGGVLPLPVAAGAGSGDGYTCVRTGSGPLDDIPPCDKQNTGDFGNADFWLYKDNCPTGQPKDRWATNVAKGVDHILSLYGGSHQPWGSTEKVDEDLCPGTPEDRPNAADTPSTGGVTTKTVADALFNGVGTLPGRFALNSGGLLADNDRTTIGSISVDNNGLWEFITPGLDSASASVPESCEEHNFVPGDTELPVALEEYFDADGTSAGARLRILLQRCIAHYNGSTFTLGTYTETGGCGVAHNQPCTGVVFGRDTDPFEEPNVYDIQYTPRFAYVPEVHSSTPLGQNTLRWAAFRPVYLQLLYGGHQGDAWQFEPTPDAPVAYAAETDAVGLTVFVLPRTSLPGTIGSDEAPFNLGENFAVRLLR